MKLTQSINSYSKPHIKYGIHGETVQILSEHDDILIVEGSLGKFPVHRDFVTDGELGEIKIEQTEFMVQKAPVKKSSKKPVQLTSTLF